MRRGGSGCFCVPLQHRHDETNPNSHTITALPQHAWHFACTPKIGHPRHPSYTIRLELGQSKTPQTQMSGYLYILSNAAHPALLKIGQTANSPEKRIRQLSSTGVPFPFVLEACFRVKSPKQIESASHEALDAYRLSRQREFFNIDLHSALNIIFPLITANYLEISKSLPEKIESELLIPTDELVILQKIVSCGTSQGAAQWRLTDQFNRNGLEVELLLTRLERKKFIKCDRRNPAHGPFWLPTTRGINFLNDNNLIEDWMHGFW